MTIDLNLYRRVIKPIVKNFVNKNPTKDKDVIIGEVAIYTNCHIVAVAYFMAELFGMSEELQETTDKLEKFYRYPEVINKEPFNDLTKGT